ncbi:MAG: serine/threonine-protein kinase [Phycisphaerales bacterium]
MSDNRERMRAIFDQARRLPKAQRAAFLDGLASVDVSMRTQIEDMLAALDEAGSFLSAPTQQASDVAPTSDFNETDTVVSPLREGPGTRIGPYKILQLIGEGGFGSVFMAEQEKPVSRKVALKIIKLGMDTRQVVARFEQERQALAMMDHPNIAKVLDAGATETGRPYFVMELVKGDPIVGYCDKNNLSIPDRLELFAQVCNAVQHAHTKGIIHRDIKPSNVLVSTQDGRPHTKVIDFGIAKATQSKLTEKTLFTEHKALIGTPEYMSPEQAEGSLDIDTRTDVYSLGVLLYELLTGSTPFNGAELRSAAYAEIQRIIREVEPPKPSTRISNNTDTIATVAARRQIEPGRLGTIVRGELDWIVMKALEKDRQRRYETATSLAADVRRYLAGEAILAAPPSTAYRFRKFIRRNRLVVTACGAVALALLVGVVAFAWQASVARNQRDIAIASQIAETQQRKAADAARAETSKRAAELKVVSDFQADMLAHVDTVLAGQQLSDDVRQQFRESFKTTDASGDQASVSESDREAQFAMFEKQWARINTADAARNLIDRTVLKPAISSIDSQFKDQPLVAAGLRQSLASVYRELGLLDAAAPLQIAAFTTRKDILGEDHPETLRSMNNLGMLYEYQGDLSQAEQYLRGSMEKSRRVLGNDDPITLAAISNLAYMLEDKGDLADAEPLYREALEGRRRVLGKDSNETLMSVNNLGYLIMSQGKSAEAEPYFREAYESRKRVFGEDDPETLVPLNNLALVLQRQGKLADAEPLYRESLAKRRKLLGEEHPQTLTALHNLGYLLNAQGKNVEAETVFRDVVEKRRRILGETHPHTLASINGMAYLLRAKGKYAEAETLTRIVLTNMRTAVGEEHQNTIASLVNLGSLLRLEDKLSEAETYLQEAMEKSRRVLGEEHPVTFNAIASMGKLRFDQGRLEEADVLYQEALNMRKRVLGESHPDTLSSFIDAGELCVARGKFADAASLLAPVEAKVKSAFTGSNAKAYATLLRNLGAARAGQAKTTAEFAEAESNLLQARQVYQEFPDASRKELAACNSRLIDLYTSWHKVEPEKGFLVKAQELKGERK